MSRTDKDRPLRVRKHDTTLARQPYHNHVQLGKEHRTGRNREQTYVVNECDIDRMSGPRDFDRICDWELVEHSYGGRGTKGDRRLYWHAPDRARARSLLDDLARSWTGDAEQMDDSAVVTEQSKGRSSLVKGYWW